jgi:hypothetical protein
VRRGGIGTVRPCPFVLLGTHALIFLASPICELHDAIVEVVTVASQSAGASVGAKPVFATFLPHANRVLLAHLARGKRAGSVRANGTGEKKGAKNEKRLRT